MTGTDTGVGKTIISCALLTVIKQNFFKTLALKPIASGCMITPKGLRSHDACLLQKHMTEKLAYSEINPFAFLQPIAPHIAAKSVNIELSVKSIIAASQPVMLLKKPSDYLVIEGIGSWLVPLNTLENP